MVLLLENLIILDGDSLGYAVGLILGLPVGDSNGILVGDDTGFLVSFIHSLLLVHFFHLYENKMFDK